MRTYIHDTYVAMCIPSRLSSLSSLFLCPVLCVPCIIIRRCSVQQVDNSTAVVSRIKLHDNFSRCCDLSAVTYDVFNVNTVNLASVLWLQPFHCNFVSFPWHFVRKMYNLCRLQVWKLWHLTLRQVLKCAYTFLLAQVKNYIHEPHAHYMQFVGYEYLIGTVHTCACRCFLVWSVNPAHPSCFNSSKNSVAESTELFQCFPALGTFVLELASVKQWYTLDIASHIPANQCLLALPAKVKELKGAKEGAKEVSIWCL